MKPIRSLIPLALTLLAAVAFTALAIAAGPPMPVFAPALGDPLPDLSALCLPAAAGLIINQGSLNDLFIGFKAAFNTGGSGQ